MFCAHDAAAKMPLQTLTPKSIATMQLHGLSLDVTMQNLRRQLSYCDCIGPVKPHLLGPPGIQAQPHWNKLPGNQAANLSQTLTHGASFACFSPSLTAVVDS